MPFNVTFLPNLIAKQLKLRLEFVSNLIRTKILLPIFLLDPLSIIALVTGLIHCDGETAGDYEQVSILVIGGVTPFGLVTA